MSNKDDKEGKKDKIKVEKKRIALKTGTITYEIGTGGGHFFTYVHPANQTISPKWGNILEPDSIISAIRGELRGSLLQLGDDLIVATNAIDYIKKVSQRIVETPYDLVETTYYGNNDKDYRIVYTLEELNEDND